MSSVAVVGGGFGGVGAAVMLRRAGYHDVTVFERSPRVGGVWHHNTYPGAQHDRPYSDRAQRRFERFPALQRLDRHAIFAFQELGALAMTRHRPLLGAFRMLGRRQINRAIKDPELRRRVTPSDELGCKQVMLTDDWYPTLSQGNVELVSDAIEQITPTGVRTADGRERPTDVIVLATGFASHAFVAPMEITAGGRTLSEEWAGVPRAYLGVSVPSFPNLFLLYGPNTNGGTGSVVFTIEAAVNHVLAALRVLDRTGGHRIEVRRDAAERFDRELRGALGRTVWHSGCTNWYLDEDGNDPNQWPWTWSRYRRRTAKIPAGTYDVRRGRSSVAALG